MSKAKKSKKQKQKGAIKKFGGKYDGKITGKIKER